MLFVMFLFVVEPPAKDINTIYISDSNRSVANAISTTNASAMVQNEMTIASPHPNNIRGR